MALIEFDQVKFAVADKEILKGIDLTIAKGEMVTVKGPSGSGKSMVFKMLVNLMTPTSGTIKYDGRLVTDYDPILLRQRVSYAFQQPILFDQTVLDNLQFPFQIQKKPFDEQWVGRLLAAVMLDQDYLTREITELSGGQKQRVALLRNVLMDPETLILDEVTAGLDEDTKLAVHNLIHQLNQEQQTTVITITHDSEEIQAAQRLITIADGVVKGESK